MPLISSPHTDKLLARCWHETPQGLWYRDDVPPCTTPEAIAIEEREEAMREDVIRRDPKRGGTPTAELPGHDRPVFFDERTGHRIGSQAHRETEEARVYEVNGEVLVNGRFVKAERLVRR